MGFTPEKIIEQVKNNEKTVHEYVSYIPIGDSVNKLQKWKKQGAEIIYLTSRQKSEEINNIKQVLKRNNFPNGQLLFRQKDEEYKSIVERARPDILIEDDCESIGGVNEMIITHLNPEIKVKIKSITVKEFNGIDNLPDDINKL